MTKIAFAFWGLARSLNFTIDSINKYIFDIFKNNNIEYKIFFHTYSIKSIYNNERSNEVNIKLDNNLYKLLNCDFIEIENQEDVKKEINFKDYRSKGDPWRNNFDTLNNFILALRSKSKVCQMITKSNIDFDYIIYLRPDVQYVQPFDLNFLKLINNNTVVIPDFHWWGGVNDRFCICNNKTYKKYGDNFKFLKDYSKISKPHSERFHGDMIINKYKLKVKKINFMFIRIRCFGKKNKADNDICKNKKLI